MPIEGAVLFVLRRGTKQYIIIYTQRRFVFWIVYFVRILISSFLRQIQYDYILNICISEEAENERMHLLTALQLRKPSRVFRFSVIAAQGSFIKFFND